MKIKKMIILFLLSFIVFNIGLIKGKAWSCTYSKLNSDGTASSGEVTLNPISGSRIRLTNLNTFTPTFEVNIYDVTYDNDCGADILKLFDQYVLGNSACLKFKDKINFATKENTCPVFLYKVRDSNNNEVYVAGDRNPSQYSAFKDRITYIGKFKSKTNDAGETSTEGHGEIGVEENVTEDESLTQKTLSCGSIDYIPGALPYFTNNLYRVVKWLVPIILILMGTIDFVRAIISQDENRMKESPRRFFRRLIAAVVVFFVLAIIQFVINVVNATGKSDLMECVDCFINDSDKCKNGSTINISEGTKLENESTTQETPTSSKTPSKSISPYSNTTKKKSTTKSKSTSKSSSKSKSNSKSKSKK